MSNEERVMWVMSMWSIWRSHNQKTWENTVDNVATIIYRGNLLLEEWRAVRSVVPQEIQKELITMTDQWRKPPTGYYKCNINASFSEVLNRVGIGLCLRDAFGLFMGAKTLCFQPIINVKLGEACGLQAAIDWVGELDLKNVIFEIDSKLVVDAYNNSKGDATEFGAIVQECQLNLSSFCQNSHVEFSRRSANMVAHYLAKAAIDNAYPQVFDDIPTCIYSLILNEMK